MTRYLLTFLSIFAVLTMPAIKAHAAEEFTEAQKIEIKKMFEEYLLESGEKVLLSVNTYQAAIQEQDRIEAGKKAAEFLKKIEKKRDLPSTGNPKGDVLMVEFFDYNCGYCSRALEEIETVLKEDDNLRVIFMDMPILGPPSVVASMWSLAAANQGKYFEYHQALMKHKGQRDEKVLVKLAKEVGLDIDQLRKDKDSQAVKDIIDSNVNLAREVNITGTPGFIIAGQIYPGYMPADQIKTIIAEARKKKD